MTEKQKKRLILILLFLLFVPNIFISSSTHRSRGGDFRGFLIAGNRFIEGHFLYADSRVATNVTWPPFFALFISPFSLLARLNLPLTQVLWYLLNAALFFLTVDIWCRLFFRQPLGWFNERKKYSLYSLPIIIPILLVAQPIFKVFVPLQINVMMLFFISLSFLYLQKEKDALSGFWLGVAIAIKVFPVLLTPYLLFRKKFKALFAAGATSLILTFLPVLRYGWNDFMTNLQAWSKISLTGGYPFGGLNQSVYAMVARWVISDPFVLMRTRIPSPPPDSPESIFALWIYRFLYAAFIGAFLFLLFRKKYRFSALEGAFLITLAMVFSPIAWRNYWILTFPAYFVLYNLYLNYKDRILLYVLASSFVLITVLEFVGRSGKLIRGFFLSVLSNLTLGTIILLLGMLYAIFKNYRSGEAESAEE